MKRKGFKFDVVVVLVLMCLTAFLVLNVVRAYRKSEAKREPVMLMTYPPSPATERVLERKKKQPLVPINHAPLSATTATVDQQEAAFNAVGLTKEGGVGFAPPAESVRK